MVPFPLDRVDRSHIEMADWCTEQCGIELLEVVSIGPHPVSRWKAFTKWGGWFADVNVLKARFGLSHRFGVLEIALPLLAGQP